MNEPLFRSVHICLAPIDPEKDAPIEADWTHDPTYLRSFGIEPVVPLTPGQIQKRYEAIEKEADERNSVFYFAVRTLKDDRLIGFARIDRLDWANGGARVALGIGSVGDRGRGFGSQVFQLLLRYAFDELSLFRLTALIPEYNEGAQRFLERAGFIEEVRRREALHRDGRRWDMIHLGLLREDWRRTK